MKINQSFDLGLQLSSDAGERIHGLEVIPEHFAKAQPNTKAPKTKVRLQPEKKQQLCL